MENICCLKLLTSVWDPTAFVQHDSELMVNARVSLWMLQPTAGQACLKGSRNVVGNIHEGCWIFTPFFTTWKPGAET